MASQCPLKHMIKVSFWWDPMGQSAWIGQTTKKCWVKVLDPINPNLWSMFVPKLVYLSHRAQFLVVKSTCLLTDKNEKHLHYDKNWQLRNSSGLNSTQYDSEDFWNRCRWKHKWENNC